MNRPTTDPRTQDPTFRPPLSFEEAWVRASEHPDQSYVTAGGKRFWLRASIAGRGPREGERVIRFMRPTGESSRAYEGCWGFRTNINRTYIDVYTAAVV